MSDSQNMFALEVRGVDRSENTSNDTAGTKASGANATGTSGSTAAGTTAPATRGSTSWYRLTGSEEYLKRYAGQRVRAHGTVRPGRDARGVDVLIHNFEPKSTIVTAIDLQPAPLIEVDTVSPASGSCDPSPTAR